LYIDVFLFIYTSWDSNQIFRHFEFSKEHVFFIFTETLGQTLTKLSVVHYWFNVIVSCQKIVDISLCLEDKDQ